LYRKEFFFDIIAFLLIFSSTVCLADLTSPVLVFKMTADDTTLLPGQTTTAHVWAWIYDQAGAEQPDNGLDTWQLDLSVDNTGVINITDINLLAPDPDFSFSGWDAASLNNPVTGEVREVAVVQKVIGAASLTAVGVDNDIDNPANYSEIFNFTIQADLSPATSTAAYTIMDDGGTGWFGILADGTEFDTASGTAYGGTYFYDAGSENVFTIVPEPGTLTMLVVMSAAALIRRRRI